MEDKMQSAQLSEAEVAGTADALEFGPVSNYLSDVSPQSGHTHSRRGAEIKNSESETSEGGTPTAVSRLGGSGRMSDEMAQAPQGYRGVLKRPGFAYLLAAQALAVFDDNTFKQILFLFAAAVLADPAERTHVIGSLCRPLYFPFDIRRTGCGPFFQAPRHHLAQDH